MQARLGRNIFVPGQQAALAAKFCHLAIGGPKYAHIAKLATRTVQEGQIVLRHGQVLCVDDLA